MDRVAAVLRGGPLDGQVFSVGQQQNEILGMNHMTEDDIYDRAGGEGPPLSSLVEDRDRASGTEDPLQAMLDRMFAGQSIVGTSYFDYRRGGGS